VLNWNRVDLTFACIAALQKVRDAIEDLVVVDNGSTDESVLRLRGIPGVTLLEVGKNLGYAGGNNVGIRYAMQDGADYLWVLNNDVDPEENSLRGLVEAVSGDESIGAAASAQFMASTNESYPAAVDVSDRGEVAITCPGCSHGFHRADVLKGPSLLLNAVALREVGLFDEEYFHYYEDVDLMERLARRGWRRGLACHSRVRHIAGA